MSGAVWTVPDQSIPSRSIDLTQSQVDVITSETTTSTSYTDLSTSGPAVTLSPGVTQDHIIHFSARSYNTGSVSADIWTSPSIAGASAIDANAGDAGDNAFPIRSGASVLASAQSSGATHTLKYKVSSDTGNYSYRKIVGVAI